MTATLGMDRFPGRCAQGFDHAKQPGLCACDVEHRPLGAITPAEWATFTAALRKVVRPDGLVHQTDMRPLIQSIFHKHRGLLYRQARTAGVIELVTTEPSTDVAGGNTDKDQKVYRLLKAVA